MMNITDTDEIIMDHRENPDSPTILLMLFIYLIMYLCAKCEEQAPRNDLYYDF